MCFTYAKNLCISREDKTLIGVIFARKFVHHKYIFYPPKQNGRELFRNKISQQEGLTIKLIKFNDLIYSVLL